MKVDQHELQDCELSLDLIDTGLMHTIQNALIQAEQCSMLIEELNTIFLLRISNYRKDPYSMAMTKSILLNRGNINMSQLANELNYSERHLRRLFMKYVGTTPKTFARIARVNYAANLLESMDNSFADIAMHAGYFDQPHLIHDFQSICSMTPQAYVHNMSHFYNDKYNR